MTFYFNPVNPACKSITGAIRENDELQLNIFSIDEKREGCMLNADFSFGAPNEKFCAPIDEDVYFLIGKDGELKDRILMKRTAFGWSLTFSIPEKGLYYYSFEVVEADRLIGKIIENPHGNGAYTSQFSYGQDFLLLVTTRDYVTPEWFKGGIMYQIFPDRFCRQGTPPELPGRILRNDWGGMPSYLPNEKGKILNNDFFGGNFKGIQSKLPYLKSLNVSVLYLNPIFHASSNHRYDTADYMNVDPMLGSNSDFKELVEEAKEYGITIILDGVFNHTGDNSVYFNKYGNFSSVGAYQSKESPYYQWYFFEEFPDKYSSWWGIDILPEINEESEDYQAFIMGKDGVLKKWLGYGIGGYRLDVADELPDDFLVKLRKSVKETNPNALIIGEVWEDAADKISYSKRRKYLQGQELDSVMNYPLKDAIIGYILTGKADVLADTMHFLQDHYPKQTLDSLMNILGTHDTERILTVFSRKKCHNKMQMASEEMILSGDWLKKATEQLKIAALLQFTLPGVPCIYYGDENGMQGYGDPFCRKCFDWEHLNLELIEFYKKLGNIRKEYNDVFKDGIYRKVYVKNGMIVYKRMSDEKNIYVFVNHSSEKYTLDLKQHIYKNLLTGKETHGILSVAPYEYGILYQA